MVGRWRRTCGCGRAPCEFQPGPPAEIIAGSLFWSWCSPRSRWRSSRN